MKLVTNKKASESCLKVLLAAEFNKIPIQLEVDGNADRPALHVNEDTKIFSLNSAVWYIFSKKGPRKFSTDVNYWLEWEASLSENMPLTINHLEQHIQLPFITGVSVFVQITTYNSYL